MYHPRSSPRHRLAFPSFPHQQTQPGVECYEAACLPAVPSSRQRKLLITICCAVSKGEIKFDLCPVLWCPKWWKKNSQTPSHWERVLFPSPFPLPMSDQRFAVAESLFATKVMLIAVPTELDESLWPAKRLAHPAAVGSSQRADVRELRRHVQVGACVSTEHRRRYSGDVVCLILSICLERMLGREGLHLPVSLSPWASASASERVCMCGYLCVRHLCLGVHEDDWAKPPGLVSIPLVLLSDHTCVSECVCEHCRKYRGGGEGTRDRYAMRYSRCDEPGGCAWIQDENYQG